MQSGNSGINFGKAISLTGRVALFITMSLLISFQANASGIKKNDQSLLIKTDTRGCATEVILASPEDNCSDSEFANNCGKNGKDCVCIRSSAPLLRINLLVFTAQTINDYLLSFFQVYH